MNDLSYLHHLFGRTTFTTRDRLAPTLARLGCENPRRATDDFDQYGVAKFAQWHRCRGHAQHFIPCTVRRLEGVP